MTTGAIRRHHQQTNTQCFFTGQMPFLSPNQQCHSIEGRPDVTSLFYYYWLKSGHVTHSVNECYLLQTFIGDYYWSNDAFLPRGPLASLDEPEKYPQIRHALVINSAKEVVFSSAFTCLFVCFTVRKITQKLL